MNKVELDKDPNREEHITYEVIEEIHESDEDEDDGQGRDPRQPVK